MSDQDAQAFAQDTAPRPGVDWGAALALEAALSALIGLVVVFLWGVTGGGTALDREVVAELMRSREGHAEDAALAELTPREREVLGFMAEGRTNAAIARAMVVTPGAVEKHISSIFAKLDLPSTNDDHRRVLAVLAFLRAGAND